jgi:hypothetical protein
MAHAKLCDELRRVFSCIDSERLRNDKERLSKFADGKLFSGALYTENYKNEIQGLGGHGSETYHCNSEFLKINMESSFHGTTPWNNTTAFQCPLHCRQRVMHGTFHFIELEVIRPSEDD